MDPVRELRALARSFSPRAARAKVRLLDRIADAPPRSERRLRSLGETLDFVRAYPDDARVLSRARALIAGLPETDNVYPYSYGVVQRLVRLFPGRLEIEWDEVEDESPILDALGLAVLPGESQAIEDVHIPLRTWFEAARPRGATDLEILVSLLERSGLPPPAQVHAFETCRLPVRYRGPDRRGIEVQAAEIHYQRGEIERGRFDLREAISETMAPPLRAGRRLVDLALEALCARDLEIYPLIYANHRDAVIVEGARGIRVGLVGVLPEWRSPLESLVFFLVLKNGVPVAYGPAAVFCGCCEVGINLFPEFRGSEVSVLYAQVLRALHHRLGADCFLLTRYAMGEDNPAAIASGAFWFYRKLGFRAENPDVERLALEEEACMRARPGYRSDRRTLRRLSNTRALLDLSGGRCAPFDFGRLGMVESRRIASEFGGDRARAQRRCATLLARRLGTRSSGRAARALAPLLCGIPDLGRWPAGDKSRLAGILRAKDAQSEARAAHLFKSHSRLIGALRELERAGC